MAKVRMTLLVEEDIRNTFHKMAKNKGKTLADYVLGLVARPFEIEDIEENKKRRMARKLLK